MNGSGVINLLKKSSDTEIPKLADVKCWNFLKKKLIFQKTATFQHRFGGKLTEFSL